MNARLLTATRLITLSLLAPFAIGVARAAPVDKPNIVFIMADDLGYGHLGCYGQKHIRTPHIDRLAHQGMRFTQAYAGCAVCAPCRSVLMTGFHMGHTSVRANSGGVPLLAEDVTVAEVLKPAGYVSGAFGKWGVGDAHTDGMATKQGFEEFFGYYHQVHAHFYYPTYLWHNDRKVYLPGNAHGNRGQYTHDEILERGLDFIRRHKDRPFFCYFPLTIPHLEMLVPEDSMRPYAGKFPEQPWRDPRRHYADQPQPFAAYAGMISRMDDGVGRIMALLDQLDLDEKTIVFFTSDNGTQGGLGPLVEFFNGSGPFRDTKASMYEGGIRVPAIARWPGRIRAGVTSDHVWYFPDVMPTLAELAGARSNLPANIDGISFVPTLLGEAAAGRPQRRHDYLYWELRRGGKLNQAVRMDDWKAVKLGADAPIELFDLGEDIGEANNIAGRHPDIVKRMQAILQTARTPMRPQGEPSMPEGQRYR